MVKGRGTSRPPGASGLSVLSNAATGQVRTRGHWAHSSTALLPQKRARIAWYSAPRIAEPWCSFNSIVVCTSVTKRKR
ncbi:MAG TPA: hypothetical protein ENN19_16085 [Chloroflexi bacterium]|nr:hypothetical protein [Chloroflexota bacterium]